jgi:hypothetical protein
MIRRSAVCLLMLTARNVAEVPLDRGLQVSPASVLLRIVPASPTT